MILYEPNYGTNTDKFALEQDKTRRRLNIKRKTQHMEPEQQAHLLRCQAPVKASMLTDTNNVSTSRWQIDYHREAVEPQHFVASFVFAASDNIKWIICHYLWGEPEIKAVDGGGATAFV